MPKRSRALVSTVLAGAAVSAGLVLAPGAQAANFGVVTSSAVVSDFAPLVANPTDGARATVIAAEKGNRSSFVFIVTGMSAAPGSRFGVHVHTGPCVAGDGAAAGPHWRTSPTDPADALHEVWLDFTVRKGGYATSKAKVPFVIPDGSAQSIVIHALPTAVGGGAGPRLACLPVAF